MKKQFQRLLYDASANDGEGGLTAMGEEVWGVIIDKQEMRDEVGGEKEDFIFNLSNTKNSFYKFIQVK